MHFRTKTILGIAVIEITLLVILVGSTLTNMRQSTEAELLRRVQLGGKLIAAAARDAVIAQDLATLDSLVDGAMTTGQLDYIRIRDAGGAVLTERGSVAVLARPFVQDRTISQSTDSIFDWSSPVLVNKTVFGEVQLGVSTDLLHGLLVTARRWAVGIAGLELVMVAMFSWIFGSYLVRQLVALKEASYHFAAGDFAYRVPVQGNDELGQVARAFNLMAQQLGDRDVLFHLENSQRLKAQQEAEFARAQAEDRTEQLNVIFELSPDGFVSFDTAHRVKYANPAFERLTWLPPAEIIQLDEHEFSALLGHKCTTQFPGVAALRAMQAEGLPVTQKIQLDNAGKRVLEVGLRESNTATISQILYFRDITHETEVDRMKSEFLTTAAHELRTPMASIYGYTELLLSQQFEEAERMDFLQIIYKQSKLMDLIITELLDLARIEARRGQDFNPRDIDLNELLPQIVAGFKVPDNRQSPGLSVQVEPVRVLVNSLKLSQAVNNLLSNAYKYSTAEVRIELLQTADAAAIRISDRGIGMTPEQLARMGERFYRADATGNIAGVGLGVSIAKEIVELHGGRLEFYSDLGAGTTVTLWLPVGKVKLPELLLHTESSLC